MEIRCSTCNKILDSRHDYVRLSNPTGTRNFCNECYNRDFVSVKNERIVKKRPLHYYKIYFAFVLKLFVGFMFLCTENLWFVAPAILIASILDLYKTHEKHNIDHTIVMNRPILSADEFNALFDGKKYEKVDHLRELVENRPKISLIERFRYEFKDRFKAFIGLFSHLAYSFGITFYIAGMVGLFYASKYASDMIRSIL